MKYKAESRTDLWDRGSSLAVVTSSPSFSHSTVGSGSPVTLQFRVTGSFRATITSIGCSTISGGDIATGTGIIVWSFSINEMI